MIFSIPVYVEEMAGPGGVRRFMARPLFAPGPVQYGEKLTRALTRLGNDLRQILKDLGDSPRHDALAEWTFHPLLEERTLALRIEVESDQRLRNFCLVGYAALDRQIWFCPRVRDFWFEVRPGQDLAERATAALTRHFREQAKEGLVDLDEPALPGKARLTVLEIELHPAALSRQKKPSGRAAIFGGESKLDGEHELRRTGRPLHSMYPDDLERAVGRDREIDELAKLFAASERRPLLLVGPRRVGKTALLHELVWRMQDRKKERYGGRREVWLLSPMRLISSMSILGQWENRVLAILDHARTKDLVLYFDDLPGLFAAGVSSASDLTVAHVLKPALERREVRIVAEITPEAWRVLRERDRAFADLFQVMPIGEPSEPETMRILIEVGRQLEEAQNCRLDLEVIPTAYELHRRYAGDAAFPGKAAGFLRRLAARAASGSIDRDATLAEFREQSGLQLALLDDRAPMPRAGLIDRLRQRVVGQDQVLAAFADILVALKARLNDPRRPLGTLLLLGPTGVGKTQSAKALAELLFGSAERLVRLDMNEYVDGSTAARLTGTPRDPEGLLTSAIRRQPFSVVLFDEIEKAAPEVFDLLLAVLDEGRLTDALGRVADFTQSVILLTSNLGVQEARSSLGFATGGGDREADDRIYVSAAEKFFRPEFFNRLDRVVPFRALTPTHLEGIARQLLDGVLARDGLRRRSSWLNVTPKAMARLVALGYHPQLGARALKRVVEREVAQPVAERLAALAPGVSLIITLEVDGAEFRLRTRELAPLPRTETWTDAVVAKRSPARQSAWIDQVLDGAERVLQRVEASLELMAPAGRVQMATLTPEQARYFFCREQIQKVEQLMQAAEHRQSPSRGRAMVTKLPTAKSGKVVVRRHHFTGNPGLHRQRGIIAIRDAASELEPDESTLIDLPDSPLTALLRELALLEAMVTGPGQEQVRLLVFQAVAPDDAGVVYRLAKFHADCLRQAWGVSATLLLPQPTNSELLLSKIAQQATSRMQACLLQGPDLDRLLSAATTVLVERPAGSTGLVMIQPIALENEAEARSLVARLTKQVAGFEAERFGPVQYRISVDGTLEDVRTGLSLPGDAVSSDFRALWLAGLPLPAELQPIMGH